MDCVVTEHQCPADEFVTEKMLVFPGIQLQYRVVVTLNLRCLFPLG